MAAVGRESVDANKAIKQAVASGFMWRLIKGYV